MNKSDKLLRNALIVVDAAVCSISKVSPDLAKRGLKVDWDNVQAYIQSQLRISKDTVIS